MQQLASEAVGADSLGRPVASACFLVDPPARPRSAFLASAAAAVSRLTSCLSAKANSPLPLITLRRCIIPAGLLLESAGDGREWRQLIMRILTYRFEKAGLGFSVCKVARRTFCSGRVFRMAVRLARACLGEQPVCLHETNVLICSAHPKAGLSLH